MPGASKEERLINSVLDLVESVKQLSEAKDKDSHKILPSLTQLAESIASTYAPAVSAPADPVRKRRLDGIDHDLIQNGAVVRSFCDTLGSKGRVYIGTLKNVDHKLKIYDIEYNDGDHEENKPFSDAVWLETPAPTTKGAVPAAAPATNAATAAAQNAEAPTTKGAGPENPASFTAAARRNKPKSQAKQKAPAPQETVHQRWQDKEPSEKRRPPVVPSPSEMPAERPLEHPVMPIGLKPVATGRTTRSSVASHTAKLAKRLEAEATAYMIETMIAEKATQDQIDIEFLDELIASSRGPEGIERLKAKRDAEKKQAEAKPSKLANNPFHALFQDDDFDQPAPTEKAMGAKVVNEHGKIFRFEQLVQGKEKEIWYEAAAVELELRIHEGNMSIVEDVPEGRRPASYEMVPEINKLGKMRIRACIGGHRSDMIYDQKDIAARTANLTDKKIMLALAVAEGADIATADLTNYYLNPEHLLAMPEYCKIRFTQLAPRSIEQFDLEKYRPRGYIIAKITGSMYGLQPSSSISQRHLHVVLADAGYYEEERNDKLQIFRSSDPTNSVCFIIHSDDFNLKFQPKDKPKALELDEALKKSGYHLNWDWAAKKYCGIDIFYNRERALMYLCQLGFAKELLAKSQLSDAKPRRTPLPFEYPSYGKQSAELPDPESYEPITEEQRTTARKFLGGALFLAICTRADIAHAVNILLKELATGTSNTWFKVRWLAGYLAKYPERGITYKASGAVLIVHSDSNFATPRSRTGGYSYLGSAENPDEINGAIEHISCEQKITTGSVAESEYIALFTNAKYALVSRSTLDAFGHLQPTTKMGQTKLRVDNSHAVGTANETVKSKRSRYVDPAFHFVKDRVRRGDIQVDWIKSEFNMADAMTKQLHPAEHERVLPLLAPEMPEFFRAQIGG